MDTYTFDFGILRLPSKYMKHSGAIAKATRRIPNGKSFLMFPETGSSYWAIAKRDIPKRGFIRKSDFDIVFSTPLWSFE